METEIKRQLPATLQALVDEIEAAAGAKIEVRCGVTHATACSGGMAGEINLGDPIRITLFCPQGPEVCNLSTYLAQPYAAFAHELLHLRRTFVERIPALYQIVGMAYGPTNDHPVYTAECLQTFSVRGLEMLLEHIVIEPQIADYGIPYTPNYIDTRAWKTIPPRPWKHEFLQRWFCLDAWIKTQLLQPHEEVRKCAEFPMEKAGLRAAARRLTDRLRILRSMPDGVPAKEAMCVAACEAFGIEPAKMGLLYYQRPGLSYLRQLDIQLRNGYREALGAAASA
jgi:hypothetical protein